ncbi:hypothetical protein ABBQ32_002144 [Trebouxia sp. C0010 RCD-2024]
MLIAVALFAWYIFKGPRLSSPGHLEDGRGCFELSSASEAPLAITDHHAQTLAVAGLSEVLAHIAIEAKETWHTAINWQHTMSFTALYTHSDEYVLCNIVDESL